MVFMEGKLNGWMGFEWSMVWMVWAARCILPNRPNLNQIPPRCKIPHQMCFANIAVLVLQPARLTLPKNPKVLYWWQLTKICHPPNVWSESRIENGSCYLRQKKEDIYSWQQMKSQQSGRWIARFSFAVRLQTLHSLGEPDRFCLICQSNPQLKSENCFSCCNWKWLLCT